MGDRIALAIAGEQVCLLADRALYWPSRRRLVIADLHLGKGSVLREGGIAVPGGGTRADLSRLAALLATTGASSLWILGDFLHGPRSSRSDAAWHQFREAHAGIDVAVLPGNHDRAFDAHAAGVVALSEPVHDGPFRFSHMPPEHAKPSGEHAIYGHLHPVIRLPGLGAPPLFWQRPVATVLPAFSLFTGGYRVQPAQARGSFACNGQQIVQIR